jgi:hypothetical protein
MDRETTLRLLDTAWDAMRELATAYDDKQLPPDLFADLSDWAEAYDRLHSLALLLETYQREDDLLIVTEGYEPELMDTCGWNFDEGQEVES